MARKRASLQGRGSEILFGTETDASSEPQDSAGVDEPEDVSSIEARAAEEPQAPAEDGEELSPEWVDLLQEEALSAAGQSPEPGADAAPDLELPPLATTPAQRAQPLAGAAGEAVEETPPEPDAAPETAGAPDHEGAEGSVPNAGEVGSGVESGTGALASAETPAAVAAAVPGAITPPAPMHVESYTSTAAGGAPMPAPKEKPEATSADQQFKMAGYLWQRATTKPSEEDLKPEGPEGTQLVFHEPTGYEKGRPSRQRRETEILASVGKAQRQGLWDETLRLYREVPGILMGEDNEQALSLLRQAQDILLEKPRQFDVAKYKVGRVQSLVSWRQNVGKWSSTYGWGIFVYEIVWIVALVCGILGSKYVVDTVLRLAGGEPIAGFVAGLWSTMMWGGMGGVVGAFYSLYWHVAQVRDFDKQYSMWYVVQPVMGMLLGALVHLLIGAGFLTAQTGASAEGRLVASFFRYALACVAGFRQQSILEIIDRVIQVITPSPQEKETKEKETPEEASAQEASAESES